MNKLAAILATVVLIIFASTATGEVVIKEVPLKWEDVAQLDGDVVFNNLCAVCHGVGGKGDGPAVSALETAVPDLTVLASNHDGVYPRKHLENVIFGRFRVVEHGTSGMPHWGDQFMYLGTGVSGIPRRAYAWERTHKLSAHIKSLQVD